MSRFYRITIAGVIVSKEPIIKAEKSQSRAATVKERNRPLPHGRGSVPRVATLIDSIPALNQRPLQPLTLRSIRNNIQAAMIVPLFPLPDVVLFPQTLLPLHIFENRYRTMTREALAGNNKIVMTLLRAGWEKNYHGNPAVHEIACLGNIETYEELEEGKYNIVLEGMHRVRLIREIKHSPYRLAEVVRIKDLDYDDDSIEIVERRNHLAGLFIRFTELATAGEFHAVDLVPQDRFEALVNMVATTLNLEPHEKQLLLEMDDIAKRCDILIPVLQRQLETLILVRDFEHLKPEDPGNN